MSFSTAVQLDEVWKRFGAVEAVRGVSLHVPAGCIYGFLGPNGAGKTTIIRMIMSIFFADEGRISVLDGQDAAAVKDRLGYLPEEKGLYKKMKVGELMTYFARLKGIEDRVARQRAAALLQRYGLGEWQDRRCEALSKGMGQKVQLLITLIHEPDLVILDEPFSGLDPVNRDLMRDLILQMRRDGKTVIFSTHIMEQAEQVCDYVALINKGEKVVDGSLSEVRSSGGRAAMLDYDGDGRTLVDLSGVVRINDSGKQAELVLAVDADSQQLLAVLLDKVQIRRFDLREPSLHEIFIRAVGGDDA
ncbi:MAG: ATP-binding cassette domain-containing protein [Candidatus Latescibacterota bacterium]|nr:ATP-binding cassette domain-containing protein [Candidatus Latescibacterota bacterium]